ncbi:MAG: DUF6602 domain-containing protein [Proteus mirabilis]|nr:DUF6602 domain-containing protein [Proteus mirabilis]
MINKASELLELFVKEETKKLSDIKMPHMPTLGSAYEEITKSAIDREFIIPKDLDLSVVSGFVSINGEVLPEQIDCMLVHGTGKRYGLTKEYFYDIENILCIFEVKKTLTKSDFENAIDHLASIRRKFADYFEEKIDKEKYEPDITYACDTYSRITGKMAPKHYSEINNLPLSDALLFYCLVQDSLAPLSIIHGYGGYKTESGLRKAFIDILEGKKKLGKGFAIPSFPSLVTSNQYCLLKGNGFPFLFMNGKGAWVSTVSMRYNVAKVILEIIWSKISRRFNIEWSWDDGLYMDNAHPLLIAEPIQDGSDVGWNFNSIEPKDKFLQRKDDKEWEPSRLNKAELSIINLIAAYGGVLYIDDDLNEYTKKNFHMTADEICEKLIFTRLFMKSYDGTYIRPINMSTYILTLDSDTGYASFERERFDLWCEKENLKPSYLSLIFYE